MIIWGTSLWNITFSEIDSAFGTDIFIDENNNIYITRKTDGANPQEGDAFLIQYDNSGIQ